MLSLSLKTSALLMAFSPIMALAQDGALGKAGRALDNVGKNIRRDVEGAVARGQITAQERELMNRITSRLQWDKKLVGAALNVEVLADGTAVLRGSVADKASRDRAADLVENTVGVTKVVDELGVAKGTRVIETKPADPARVIVIQPSTPVPSETKVIVKP